MSVITSKSDEHYPARMGESIRTACSGKLVRYPFLYWSGGGDPVQLCDECCEGMRRGLVADIIHINAIRRMRRFSEYTLIRPPHMVTATGEVETRAIEREPGVTHLVTQR